MEHQTKIELLELLNKASNIVITNHINPDGDAMGSALGLQLALSQMGISSKVIIPNADSPNLQWMKGRDAVLVADSHPGDVQQVLADAEIVFCLDYNTLSRTGDFVSKCLESCKAKMILIDHHQQPDTHFKYSFSDTSKSSTCEMVFDFVDALYGDEAMSKAFAECIYSGILTDSGAFRFSTTTAHTHRVTAKLLELGAIPNEIHERIFDGNTLSRMKLLGYMLDNLEILSASNAIILALPESVLKDIGYQKGDTEGFVNYGLSINNMRLSAFFREENDGVKISFRSKGELDVNTFSRTYFNGGGHRNAAGGKFEGSLSNAIAHFKESWKEYSKSAS